ncbi:alpha/beta hydrolase [Pseudonocardia sp. ICBG601]|uniref:alpha/beta hydrolase n=1 Tax=Pseudonocardia sp. ICBG601 TaxID=2846759 RepID=UPI001CF6C372|nr:alpha/beta hydrolase [Pseudonocardia sp. ICBG601]
MTSFLRVLAWVWAALLLVVLVGTFRPETPAIGLAGSFLSGAYPLHVALAGVLGILFGLAARAAGARFTGVATAVLALAAVVGSVTVLAAQGRAASEQGVPLDWTAALTELGQPDGKPDRSVEFAPGRTLDLYLPTGAGPHPTMVWVHGGSWTSGDRSDRTALNRWLAERGWAVAAVDYRLPPPEPVGRDQQRDVACAVDWVRAHAGEAGLDPRAAGPGRAVRRGDAGAVGHLRTARRDAGVLRGTRRVRRHRPGRRPTADARPAAGRSGRLLPARRPDAGRPRPTAHPVRRHAPPTRRRACCGCSPPPSRCAPGSHRPCCCSAPRTTTSCPTGSPPTTGSSAPRGSTAGWSPSPTPTTSSTAPSAVPVRN